MNREELEVMKDMPENDGWTPNGYGPPCEISKYLISIGFIELETVEKNGNIYWKARTTQKGRRAITGNG